MDKIYINATGPRLRTALKENGEVTEVIYEQDSDFSVGNIYIGRVTKVLRGQFIFVEIGHEKNAFLQPDPKKEPKIYNEKGKIILKEGDSLAVQLVKPAYDEKGCVVTTRLNFTGKYTVLIANDTGIGVSQKIKDNEKRQALKGLATELLPENHGIIMRTGCESCEEGLIREEINSLLKISNEVAQKESHFKPPVCVYKEKTETLRIIRDLSTGKNVQVITDSREIAEEISLDKDLNIECELYTEKMPLFSAFGIETAIEKALNKRVWLKNGAYLIFDYTEAMNVIDVNSGKFTGKNLKDFALKVNMEAAKEIAGQIRLRNLTGMIIIDFIDMGNEEHVKQLSDYLRECISRDRVSTTLVGMTGLGLMQLTRKKRGLPLHKLLLKPCPTCAGTGLTENEFYIVDKILNSLIVLLTSTIYKNITIRAGKPLISALKANALLKRLKNEYNAQINLVEITTGKLYYYEIEKEVN